MAEYGIVFRDRGNLFDLVHQSGAGRLAWAVLKDAEWAASLIEIADLASSIPASFAPERRLNGLSMRLLELDLPVTD